MLKRENNFADSDLHTSLHFASHITHSLSTNIRAGHNPTRLSILHPGAIMTGESLLQDGGEVAPRRTGASWAMFAAPSLNQAIVSLPQQGDKAGD